MKQDRVRKKQLNLEVLRVIASIGVVAIHVSTQVVIQGLPISVSSWLGGVVLNIAFHWAVPIFLMISGYLFLEEKEVVSQPFDRYSFEFWKKRVQRVLPPLIFWILFYAVGYHFFRHDPLTLDFVIKRILFDQPYEHLYFLFLLLFLAMVTPFLQKVGWQLYPGQKGTLYFFLACLCFIFPPTRLVFLFWIPYAAYFFLGPVVPLCIHKLNLKVLWLVLLWLVVSGITVFSVVKSNFSLDGVADPFAQLSYFSPYLIMMSCLTFGIATHPNIKQKLEKLSLKQKSYFMQLSEASLGIYLIHVSFIVLLMSQKYVMNIYFRYGGVATVVGTVAVYGLSFLLVHAFKKITSSFWKGLLQKTLLRRPRQLLHLMQGLNNTN